MCKFDGSSFTKLELSATPMVTHEWELKEYDLWFRMGWDHYGPLRYDGDKLYQLEFPRTSQIDEFYNKHPNASYSPYGIYEIYKDQKGHIWFGTAAAGVYRFDGEQVEWMYEKHLSKTPSGGSFGIRSIIEDKDGFFWICNNKHRYKFSEETKSNAEANYLSYQRIDGIKAEGQDQDELPYFLSVTKDKNDELWFSTYDDGVYHYDGDKLHHFTLNNIGNPQIRTILADNKNNIWLGTQSSGIYKMIDKEFKKVIF